MAEDPTQSVKAENNTGDNAPINVKVWCKLFPTLKIVSHAIFHVLHRLSAHRETKFSSKSNATPS